MKPSSFYLPVTFLIVTFILLVIPGNEFPKAKVFDIPGLDKIVHTGIFFLLVYLFCRPFKYQSIDAAKKKAVFIEIALYAFVYGVIMEFVQKFFVPFRSFELADIMVDGLGALIGFLFSKRMISTKPNP